VIAESTLLRVVLSLALVYAAVGACAWLYSDRLIFLPPPPGYPDGPAILKVPTKDGQRIAAVYRKNPSATYTLLLSHGNAEDLSSLMPLLAVLGDWGFSVLAYDYRGYGRSEGTPSEPHVYADVDAAYDYLVRELQVEPGHVVAYGRSLGAGAALDLAVHRPLGGLVLESPFLSAFRVMTRISLFPFDKFRNSAKIGRVRCPVLVMHGEDDEIVPFWHGRRLFDLAPEPKMLVAVPGAHHNDFVQVAGPRYAQALRDFETRLRGH
jgi:abhydrolase domain-containing protein 17